MSNKIRLNVTDQAVEILEWPEILVEGAQELYEAEFVFDASWAGYTKEVHFKARKVERYKLLTGNTCTVPQAVLLRHTYLQIGVRGLKGAIKRPTIWSPMRAATMPGAGGNTPALPPTPDYYEQVLSQAKTHSTSAASSAAAAGRALEDIQEIAGEIRDVVGTHNEDPDAHGDIRQELAEVAEASEEALALAAQRNQARGYESYAALIAELNGAAADAYPVGQSCYIITLDVPDLWISGVEDTSTPYEYVDDVTVVATLQSVGYIRAGYYRLSALETLKQDLSDYVRDTDYATNATPGIGIAHSAYGITMRSGGKYFAINPSTKAHIDAGTDEYQALTMALIDYAVRRGIIANTIPLTEEEQAVAQSWLGGQMVRSLYGQESVHLLNMQDGVYLLPRGFRVIYNANNSSYQVVNATVASVALSENTGRRNCTFLDGQTSVWIFENIAEATGGITQTSHNTLTQRSVNEQISGVWSFSKPPKITASLPPDDNSTNIPNTAWVRQAIPVKYITPETYGATGDGVTDDSAAIQAAIDAASYDFPVYLGKKTYKIDTGLVIDSSRRKIMCDGTLSYSGTDSAITISSLYNVVDIDCVDAPNGTALKLDGSSKAVNSSIIRINKITSSKIGLHLYTNANSVCYNQMYIGRIESSETGVLVWADSSYINENWYYLGRIGGGCSKGIWLHADASLDGMAGFGTNDNRFFSGSTEGISDDGCAIHIDHSNGNQFNNFRVAESYGENALIFSGFCSGNDIRLSTLCLNKIDISNYTGGDNNILKSPKITDGTEGYCCGNEAWLNYYTGITYDPKNADVYYEFNATNFPDDTIKRVGVLIPTSLYLGEAANDKTIVIDSIYSWRTSMARGFPVSLRFSSTKGLCKIIDSNGKTILDNTDGRYCGQMFPIHWAGYAKDKSENLWTVGAKIQEEWTFTLSDGTSVTKKVVLG